MKNPFEVDTDASGYAMEVLLMWEGRPICYHFKVFHGVVLKYLTYDKDLYALVQAIKYWKHYLMGKETIIQTYHKPLEYLHTQS